MLFGVFIQMSRNHIIKNGISKEFQSLIAVCDCVVMVGCMSESLKEVRLVLELVLNLFLKGIITIQMMSQNIWSIFNMSQQRRWRRHKVPVSFNILFFIIFTISFWNRQDLEDIKVVK